MKQDSQPRQAEVTSDPLYIQMKNKLEAARDRLHRGEKRQTRKVRRSKDGQTYPATEMDDPGDLTDESYYLPAPSQLLEKPVVKKKATKDKGTVTVGLAVEPKPKAAPIVVQEMRGLPLDILPDEDFFNVLAALGAVPAGTELKGMPEKEIIRMITKRFAGIPSAGATTKSAQADLQQQKLAEWIAADLIKRMEGRSDSPTVAPNASQQAKLEHLQSPEKEKMTKPAENAAREQTTEPKAGSQMKQQAQQTSVAASTSRIDQETSRLSPRNQ